MVPSASDQTAILKEVTTNILERRQSIDSIGCKITCAEDNVGMLYQANWTMAGGKVLLQYTHVASDSQGLPSAFYFDGSKNYFIEVQEDGGFERTNAHVLTGSAPFGEPSPLRSSYFFYGSWLDQLIVQHKTKISGIRETDQFGQVYDIRIEIPRRVLIIEVAPAYGFAIIKTSELRNDGEIINVASEFEEYGTVWLPHKADFNSTWTHNDITSSWHRSYIFSDIKVNSLSADAASWTYTDGSVIADGITNTKIILSEGVWKPLILSPTVQSSTD